MKKVSLSVRFGLVTSVMLIGYFLILSLFNKHINPAFSFFNAVITACGIWEAVRINKLENQDDFSYSQGFKTGMVTGLTATLLFTVFFLVYTTEINIGFLPKLIETINGSFNAGTGMITFVVAIMGVATTIVSTLAAMQFFKISRNIPQN